MTAMDQLVRPSLGSFPYYSTSIVHLHSSLICLTNAMSGVPTEIPTVASRGRDPSQKIPSTPPDTPGKPQEEKLQDPHGRPPLNRGTTPVHELPSLSSSLDPIGETSPERRWSGGFRSLVYFHHKHGLGTILTDRFRIYPVSPSTHSVPSTVNLHTRNRQPLLLSAAVCFIAFSTCECGVPLASLRLTQQHRRH